MLQSVAFLGWVPPLNWCLLSLYCSSSSSSSSNNNNNNNNNNNKGSYRAGHCGRLHSSRCTVSLRIKDTGSNVRSMQRTSTLPSSTRTRKSQSKMMPVAGLGSVLLWTGKQVCGIHVQSSVMQKSCTHKELYICNRQFPSSQDSAYSALQWKLCTFWQQIYKNRDKKLSQVLSTDGEEAEKKTPKSSVWHSTGFCK